MVPAKVKFVFSSFCLSYLCDLPSVIIKVVTSLSTGQVSDVMASICLSHRYRRGASLEDLMANSSPRRLPLKLYSLFFPSRECLART